MELDRSSLESLESDPSAGIGTNSAKTLPPEPGTGGWLSRRRPRLKLLVIGLIALLLLGVGFSITIHRKPTKTQVKVTINTQSLDNGTLNKLTAQFAKNGQTQQQLTISPNTLFKSDVTVQGASNLNGDLTVKGATNLLGPVATGNNLTVGGGLTVGRNASIGGSLSVAGTITAGNLNVGTITLSTLSLSGNFSWGGHLISTGAAPTTTPGVIIGNGTVTVTGNDSIGTVVITTGSSGLMSNGEMAIIHFRTKYSGTPIVQLTPTDPGAAGLQYFAGAASGFFVIRTNSPPASNTLYTFNYFVSQ